MRDIYQEVTAKIIASMESAIASKKRWQPSAMPDGTTLGRPVNVDGRPYHGINVALLWGSAQANGFSSPVWGTYNAWRSHGAQVQAGEKGTLVVFYKQLTKTVEQDGEETEEKFAVARGYVVFNAAQVSGYQSAPVVALPEVDRNAQAESFIAATGINIAHGGDKAFYSPHYDMIRLPHPSQFADMNGYYATALHELTHATGHEKRCNRQFGKRFGDDAYAAEELVAELGAAYLCADLSLSAEPREDHAPYLASWLKVLKNDKRAIFTAASKADQAATFLHSLQSTADGASVAPSTPAVVVAATIGAAPLPVPVAPEPMPVPVAAVPIPAAEPVSAPVVTIGGLRSYKRSEKWIGTDLCVRRVPCFSRNAPTVYAVIRDGKWINSFLTSPAAMAWARKQLASIDSRGRIAA